MSRLKCNVNSLLYPLQFAHREGRGTVDAVNTVTRLTLQQLETSNAYARFLFVDFSSAFNTLQPQLLLAKLVNSNANHLIIKWLFFFFFNNSYSST